MEQFLFCNGGGDYYLKKNSLIIKKDGITCFKLNLGIRIDEELFRFDSAQEIPGGIQLASLSHPYTARLIKQGNYVLYQAYASPGRKRIVEYFRNSYANICLVRNFTYDYQNYNTVWEKNTIGISATAIPPQEEANSNLRTWALIPHQRAFAMRLLYIQDCCNPWVGFSIPGIISAKETCVKMKTFNSFSIAFNDINIKADGNLPEVDLCDNLDNAYSVLREHDRLSKSRFSWIQYPYAEWWSRPVFTPNSDLDEHYKVLENKQLGYEFNCCELQELIEHIERKTKIKNFTILIDGYWFQNVGNYFEIAKNVFGNVCTFRKFIDNLHQCGHKVILWMSHFHVTYPLAPTITEEMLIKVGPYLAFDYTHPKVRRYIQSVIRLILSGDDGCLNADGIKLDYGFVCPSNSDGEPYDITWGYGDELRYKVGQLIYECAHGIKPDAMVSDTSAEPYVASDVIRLNDVWGEEIAPWLERARKATATSGKIIDTDGLNMFSRKFKAYSMIAPALGAPSFYCGKKFFAYDRLEESDYKRLCASWNVYQNAPVTPSMNILVNMYDEGISRCYTDGPLGGFYSAICLGKNVLVTYSEDKVMIAATIEKYVEIPFPHKYQIVEALAVSIDGNRQLIKKQSIITFPESIILKTVDSAADFQWVELRLSHR
jgi:hypothetical protein